MPVDRSELALVWPRALFRAAADDLLANPPMRYSDDGSNTVGFLLAEAFHGDRGLAFFRDNAEAPPLGPPSHWGHPASSFPHDERPRVDLALLQGLVDDLEQIPLHVPRRYYAARRRGAQPVSPLDGVATRSEFARTVTDLVNNGYLDDALGPTCCDVREPQDGQGALQEMLDDPGLPLWPVTDDTAASWDEDTFLSIVEACFDLVARPRRRDWHEFCEEWDYSDFSRPVGQEVYLWKVNTLLERTTIPLRLATTGPDRGQLVTHVDDPRTDLYDLPAHMPHPHEADDVAHAIQLWRSRHATRADKRDAVTRLANLLEPYRPALRDGVGKPDTDALFNIANNFDLRHHNQHQRRDYPDEVLDWLFWWYLATLDLAVTLTGDTS